MLTINNNALQIEYDEVTARVPLGQTSQGNKQTPPLCHNYVYAEPAYLVVTDGSCAFDICNDIMWIQLRGEVFHVVHGFGNHAGMVNSFPV